MIRLKQTGWSAAVPLPRGQGYGRTLDRGLRPARSELLSRLGRTEEAGDAYRRALALVDDEAERRLLERRLAELSRRRSFEPWRRGVDA